MTSHQLQRRESTYRNKTKRSECLPRLISGEKAKRQNQVETILIEVQQWPACRTTRAVFKTSSSIQLLIIYFSAGCYDISISNRNVCLEQSQICNCVSSSSWLEILGLSISISISLTLSITLSLTLSFLMCGWRVFIPEKLPLLLLAFEHATSWPKKHLSSCWSSGKCTRVSKRTRAWNRTF